MLWRGPRRCRRRLRGIRPLTRPFPTIKNNHSLARGTPIVPLRLITAEAATVGGDCSGQMDTPTITRTGINTHGRIQSADVTPGGAGAAQAGGSLFEVLPGERRDVAERLGEE